MSKHSDSPLCYREHKIRPIFLVSVIFFSGVKWYKKIKNIPSKNNIRLHKPKKAAVQTKSHQKKLQNKKTFHPRCRLIAKIKILQQN